MKLLCELLTSVHRIQDELPSTDVADSTIADVAIDDNTEVETGDEFSSNENPALDDVADTATDDPNRQGLIRTVKKAHLVFKRTGDDGTFTELWLYNLQNLQQQTQIKRAILAGTDIPPNQTSSPDGSQTYMVWAVGNAEMLQITGLPS